MDRNENNCALLIWAKFSRYPWWPAFLTGNKEEDAVEVKFFGTFEYSLVKPNCVRPFKQAPNFDQKDLRNKGLQFAIRSAYSVCDGRSTIAEEMEKVARGEYGSPSERASCRLTKLSEESHATEDSMMELLVSKPISLDDLSRSNTAELGFASVGSPDDFKPEPFEALYKQLRFFFDKLTEYDMHFPHNFEIFCSFLRACLEENYTKQLAASDLGRMLVQLKLQVQNSSCPKEQRREFMYEINGLMASMKRKIVTHFFSKSLNEGDAECDKLSADVAEKIMDLAFSSKEEGKPPHPYSAAKQTSSHRSSKKSAEELEIDNLKEKFKLSLDIRNRILKKFSKILLQNSNQKLTKKDCERLAKGIHEEIYNQSNSLVEYKRGIVLFVQKRAELCSFFSFENSSDSVALLELFCTQLLPLVLN